MLVSYPMAKKAPENSLKYHITKGIYNDWKELFKSEQ